MTSNEYKQLKSSDIKEVRTELLKEQNFKCKLCNKEIKENDKIALDHQHMTKSEIVGEDGAGLVRGVLCLACNCMEGKVWNNAQRYIQADSVQDRIDFLEKLIIYYKKDNLKLIHPNEKPKEKAVSKRNYNKLKKSYILSNKKRKFPEYPKSEKLTKVLSLLFNEFDIKPYN